MMKEDIAPELIKSVNKDFEKNIDNDTVKSLEEKAAQGKASYEDAYKYAEKIGEARSKALQGNVTPEALPDGKMYYNIADRLMNDSLSTDHDMVAEYAVKAQEAANRKAGIGLKAQKADLEQDRIDSFVNGLCGPEGFPIEEVAWKMGEPVVTHARTVVDSTIKKNAEFQHKAGIRATVTRKAAPRCCDWCTDLEGDYTYPNVPGEVFQRHDRCKCTVEYNGKKLEAYKSGNGARHTFREQSGERERAIARKQLAIEKEAQNDIMKAHRVSERAKSGKMHNEKYGDAAIIVNEKYISSDEYMSKFKGITNNEEVDSKICEYSRAILKDRSGTKNETLILLDKRTGDEILTIHADTGQHIVYSEADKKAISEAKKEGAEIVSIHNHPTGYPPTADDCVSAKIRGYDMGVACGHNGTVHVFYPSEVDFTDEECKAIHNIIAEESVYESDINKVLKTWKSTLSDYGMTIKERR